MTQLIFVVPGFFAGAGAGTGGTEFRVTPAMEIEPKCGVQVRVGVGSPRPEGFVRPGSMGDVYLES
ncbi:hypothetical protein [Arthrobacter sp. NtRootA1]|uniref:hypothetical protein n=1 Tax=Arthrobacter sp. NtRootA1 TaxID=2830983 RepID=UPI001CC4A1A6|nr:hypothetical protein [Arthrobacter sp. NtRootA1]